MNAGISELSKVLAPIKSKHLKFPPLLLLGHQREPLLEHIWSKLAVLNLCNCGLTRLDSSLHMVPNLIQLDVSHNDLRHIIHLYQCLSLATLNIAHNRISVLSNLNLVIPNIRRLNLSHNSIESLDGLDKLYSLEKIDLSHNKLNDFSELSALVKLQNFTHLYASGNPISFTSNYRLHILTQFLHESSLNGRVLPVLDGLVISSEELSTLQSSIFLPPEILTSDNTRSDAQSTALLIGGTLMKPDDVPIHELNKFFAFESGKSRAEASPAGLLYGGGSNSNMNASPSFLSREQVMTFCQRRLAKRKRKYRVRSIQDEEEKTLIPVDIVRMMRASSTGSNHRQSNETLTFSDAGLHLLEFEDLEGAIDQQQQQLSQHKQLSPHSPFPTATKSPSLIGTSQSSTGGDSACAPTRSDSMTSSNEMTNTNTGSQNGSIRSHLSLRIREMNESKSTDSVDIDLDHSRRSYDSTATASYSTYNLSDEVPDLSVLMQQMAQVSITHAPPVVPSPPAAAGGAKVESQKESEDGVNSVDNSFSSQNNHLKILMDLVNEDKETPLNSPSSIGGAEEKSEESPQRIGIADNSNNNSSCNNIGSSQDSGLTSVSDLSAAAAVVDQNSTGRRTRVGRWGKTKPPLSTDLKSFAPSKSSSHYSSTPCPSQRSNSPPGSIHSADNWESKHQQQRPNYDTQTEVSSVYSGEDPVSSFYPASHGFAIPTTSQIAHHFQRATQEEAQRFSLSLASASAIRAGAGGGGSGFFSQTHGLGGIGHAIQTYTGSLEFEYLSVADNLEKYFFEQVFHENRPSREAPYMRHEYSSTSASSSSQRHAAARHDFSDLQDLNPLEVLYVDIPYQPEKLLSVFRVNVLDISQPPPELSPSSTSASTSSSASVSISMSSPTVPATSPSSLVIPEPLIFALTDLHLYILLDTFGNPTGDPDSTTSLNGSNSGNGSGSVSGPIFADAPLPVLRRVHPIDSLRSCIVYFNFQRCAFQFRDDDINPLHKKKYSPSTQQRRQATTSYMILTHDKSLTYPLITSLPSAANAIRQERYLSKVIRENRDLQLFDCVTDMIQSIYRADVDKGGGGGVGGGNGAAAGGTVGRGGGYETDLVYYQMLSQIWRQKPGIQIPRTFIITPKVLLLCHEDITSINIRLQLIDSVHVSNIYRVRLERDDPLKITIIMKPEGALSFTKRKWRLMAVPAAGDGTQGSGGSTSGGANMILKMRDEIRKTCADANVPHDW
jgi:hypothetical protein